MLQQHSGGEDLQENSTPEDAPLGVAATAPYLQINLESLFQILSVPCKYVNKHVGSKIFWCVISVSLSIKPRSVPVFSLRHTEDTFVIECHGFVFFLLETP